MTIEAPLVQGSLWSVARRNADSLAVGALVLGAIGLRLVPILVSPSLNWGDEVFQTTEQAHRLVYGTGLVPWEFQLGVRSWLLPGAIAALMELARLIGDGPDYYLPVIATGLAALGAAPVVCAYLWCRREFGIMGAIVGGFVTAVAPELVYFGARALNDTVSAHLLVIALYVLEPSYPVTARRRLCFGGFLLGFIGVLRIQLAPSLALIALWTVCRAPRSRLGAFVIGAAIAVLLLAAFDAVTLGAPLASVWRYLLYNVVYDVSAGFGVEPWYYYFAVELGVWQFALVPLAILTWIGARRLPLPLLCAAVIVLTHSVIAHKEFRFIYPAMTLFLIVMGMGLAQLAAWGRERLQARGMSAAGAIPLATALALISWGMLALSAWAGPDMTALRARANDNLRAARAVEHGPAPCGIGLYAGDAKVWAGSGGYTYFHRNAPIYWPKDATEFAVTAPAFDTLVFSRTPPLDLGFVTQQCFGEVCIARRPGRCTMLPMMPMPFPQSLAPAGREQPQD